ncbi:hypothetical protein SAMN05443287_108189 [Micromonospora phaseoli]|uniref:Uncharacterized protein n=1 Tax=Micromonospora phaseoli TaxID=1144548 RepID=A0A1H7CD38_9ACTN|nr:hypothetical protein [Micromonospora phaseoli]PZV92672.1 hypothetical protein CLV64_11095 [Micromonospora phaseoli]SEJ83575.1 hypothetical protein SAMN05443287_108189 [Micromonospora phaseoli]
MINGRRRSSWLSGFWTCLVGGAVIATLLMVLDPIMRYEECPNYGGNGNASAFDNPAWEFWFPIVLLGWLVLVVLEQTLPVTRRHRSGAEVAVRAASAFTLSVLISCCLFLNVAVVCR